MIPRRLHNEELLICTHEILLADQIEVVTDGACDMHKAEGKHTQDFGGET